MKYYVLASGSKGNCFVVKNKEAAIVIDCGSTKSYLTRSFHNIGLDYQSVKALFITHDHSDHIKQIKMFQNSRMYCPFEIKECDSNIIHPYDQIDIGGFHIQAIPLSHDSNITLGYVIESDQEKLVYITDTGYIQESHHELIYNADYYILESNHDPELLMQCNRPMYIKSRILSDSGHLCNEDCAAVLKKVVFDNTKEIVLAHISEQANRYDLAVEVTKRVLIDRTGIVIQAAKQFEIMEGGKL